MKLIQLLVVGSLAAVIGIVSVVPQQMPVVLAAPGQSAPIGRAFLNRSSTSNYPISYYNWSGYAATSSKPFVSVETTYVQPSVSCPAPGAQTLFWVGFDGFQNNTVEQAGTGVQCDNSSHPQPTYYAWWEMFPTNGVTPMPLAVKPGDVIKASVSYDNSTGNYTMTVHVNTNRHMFSQTAACAAYSGCARASAEWVVERPYLGSDYTPLAQWQNSVTFYTNKAADSVKGNGRPDMNPLKSFADTPINMVDHPYTGKSLATVSPLNSRGFSATWLAAQ